MEKGDYGAHEDDELPRSNRSHAFSRIYCDYKLDAAIRGDASIKTREAIADKAVEMLRHELPTAWQDNVQLFYLPYAIEKILGFKYTAAKICERLGMENFSNAPIKSPFVKFEQLEPGGGFAILDAPERLETEERSELISMNAFSQETRETQNEFLMAVLSPDLLPIPNPLGNLKPYIKITISDELQKIALIAGEWPAVFGPVKSSTDSLHRLLWSSNHTLVVQMTIRFLVTLGVFSRGYWKFPLCRAIHHKFGSISTPADVLQILLPITRKDCVVSLDNNILGVNRDTWDIQSMYLLNGGTRLFVESPITYIILTIPTESAAIY